MHTNFGGNADEHVFAVFDGHGELGRGLHSSISQLNLSCFCHTSPCPSV